MKKIYGILAALCLVLVILFMPEGEARASEIRDDSTYIQNLIDTATPNGNGIKVVTVPKVNPYDPNGRSVYQIGKAIELPSNVTVKLDNCTLRLNDGVLCNVFIISRLFFLTLEDKHAAVGIMGNVQLRQDALHPRPGEVPVDEQRTGHAHAGIDHTHHGVLQVNAGILLEYKLSSLFLMYLNLMILYQD